MTTLLQPHFGADAVMQRMEGFLRGLMHSPLNTTREMHQWIMCMGMAVRDGHGHDYFQEAIDVAFPMWAALKAEAEAFPRLPPKDVWMNVQPHHFPEYLDGMAVLAQVSKGRALLTDNPDDLGAAGFLPMALLACMEPELPSQVRQQFRDAMSDLKEAGYELPIPGVDEEADRVLDALRIGFLASPHWRGTGDVYSLYVR